MPRASRVRADEHHRVIESAASRLFRERGFACVSVAELMGQAGLTHGGFYAHYPSKDALAAAACASAFTQSLARWQQRLDAAATPRAALEAIVGGYLDPASRERAGTACPTATLASDVAREKPEHAARAAYLDGVRAQIDVLASLQHSGEPTRDRQQACAQLATLAGALLLARATRGDALSDQFLAAARHAVLDHDRPVAAPPTAPPAAAAAAGRARRAATHRTRRGLPKGTAS